MSYKYEKVMTIITKGSPRVDVQSSKSFLGDGLIATTMGLDSVTIQASTAGDITLLKKNSHAALYRITIEEMIPDG